MQNKTRATKKWVSLGILTISICGSSCGREAAEFERVSIEEPSPFHTTEDARPARSGVKVETPVSAALSRPSEPLPPADDSQKAIAAPAEAIEPIKAIEPQNPAAPTVPNRPEDRVEPIEPTRPTVPEDPDETANPVGPEEPIDPVAPDEPIDTVGPVVPDEPPQLPDPITQEPRNVHVSFGHSGSIAAYISCAEITLSSANDQHQVFDLGCAGASQSHGEQHGVTIEWPSDTVCIQVGITVRTFRNAGDFRRGQRFWERTLATDGSTSDSNYFRISEDDTGAILIGYEDLPLPYPDTDQDHDDLILSFGSTPGLDLSFPPLTSGCTTAR